MLKMNPDKLIRPIMKQLLKKKIFKLKKQDEKEEPVKHSTEISINKPQMF